MNEKSIGLIELSSIAAGFQVADTMLKAGNVRLLLSRSICSGKYMVLIGGDTAAVESAVAAGAEAANGCLIDQLRHPQSAPGRVHRRSAARKPVNPTARWAFSNRSTSPP